jgi:hypothetical protein
MDRLQNLPKSKRNAELHETHRTKKRKIEHTRSPSSSPAPIQTSQTPCSSTLPISQQKNTLAEEIGSIKNGESLSALRKMIFGQLEYTESQQL